MIELNGYLRLEDFQKVIFEKIPVSASQEVIDRVQRSHEFLKEFAQEKIIYGVNTGFGPMAQYRIDEDKKTELQYNLIRSHCTGSGEVLDTYLVRAAMLARLNTLCLGRSGVHLSVIELLVQLINLEVSPVIFAHGGVGASGDLVQLAHIALVMIGEGEVIYEGERRPTTEVFTKLGLSPITVVLREGLALINGTSVMTGIGLVNTFKARHLINWMISASSAINEIVQAYDDHLSEGLNGSKLHQGQQRIAKAMRDHLCDSRLTRKREHHLYGPQADQEIFTEKVQEYYSLRCVPQVLGPILETLENCEKILIEEANSANDNPIVDAENEQVYHGGNFHGDYVSLEMDKLKAVMCKMSMLSERQLNYLLNDKLNDILPPFVNLGTLGFNFGMQGAQFTATSTTAENQVLSNPMYVHSIPSNNDNQDIVSMGANSALMCKKVIDNTMEVLAIELMTLAQAIDCLDIEDRLSSKTLEMHQSIRARCAKVVEDSTLYGGLHRLKVMLDPTKND